MILPAIIISRVGSAASLYLIVKNVSRRFPECHGAGIPDIHEDVEGSCCSRCPDPGICAAIILNNAVAASGVKPEAVFIGAASPLAEGGEGDRYAGSLWSGEIRSNDDSGGSGRYYLIIK
jgi:hypothetical protein